MVDNESNNKDDEDPPLCSAIQIAEIGWHHSCNKLGLDITSITCCIVVS